MRTHVALVAVWALASMAACSQGRASDAGTDAANGLLLPNPPMDPLAACLAVARAEATYEVGCRRLAASDVGDAGSGYVGGQCPAVVYDPREGLFDAGRLAFSATAVTCTVSWLETLACNVESPVLNPSCGPLAWGNIAAGGTCDDPYSCGGGLYCLRNTPLQPCGVCSPDVAEGDDCGPTANGAQCAAGDCNGGTCRAAGGQGGACDLNTAVCGQGLSCQDVGCEPPQDGGLTCNSSADCLDGLVCGAFSSLCQPAPFDGGDCSVLACAAGWACAQDRGICALLTPGGSCVDTDGGPACLELESCRDGGCVPLSPVGGTCGREEDCAVGSCVSGACALLGQGQSCRRDQDCQSQRCDAEGSGTCAPECG